MYQTLCRTNPRHPYLVSNSFGKFLRITIAILIADCNQYCLITRMLRKAYPFTKYAKCKYRESLYICLISFNHYENALEISLKYFLVKTSKNKNIIKK